MDRHYINEYQQKIKHVIEIVWTLRDTDRFKT